MEKQRTALRKLDFFRILLMALGGFMMMGGFFAYQIGLSSSKSMSGGKVFMIILGAGLFMMGLLGRRIVQAYKIAAIILLNSVLLLIGIEIGLLVKTKAEKILAKPLSSSEEKKDLRYIGDGREDLPYFKSHEWASTYWSEYHQVWDERILPYEPYIVWRSKPFTGKTIHINEEGLRITPGAQDNLEAYKVFMFGGSTLWGTGVPDWGTIPAFLQAELKKEKNKPCCVINFSEQAWVSTQSVIQLILELRSGNIPDTVIFYDGINDVFAAYQSGKAGVHQNLGQVAARFEEREEIPPFQALLSKTRTFRFLQRLALGKNYKKRTAPYKAKGFEESSLAKEICQTYLENCEFIKTLSARYGFDVLFFWQPYLLTDKKILTPEEQQIKKVAQSVYPGLIELHQATNEHIKNALYQHSNLSYLVDIFKDLGTQVYIDPFHVTMESNRLIAQKMQEALKLNEK